MMSKNNDILDAISEALTETEEHFLSVDPFYYFMPYLHKDEIDRECPFFQDNRVSLPDDVPLTSSDLKTISYLSLFYRSRVAYNPKNIDFYLRALGWMPYNETAMDIVVYDGDACGDATKKMRYSDYLKNVVSA